MFVCLPNESRGCHAACRAGFTLIELLVVIAVIAVLAMLAFGGAKSAIRSSQTAGSLSNMRQLTGALINFAADNNNMLPSSRDANNVLLPAWDLQIFPYLGVNDGYSGSPESPQLNPGLGLELFRCPLDSRKVGASDAVYPRSYGVTGTAVYWRVGGNPTKNSGGIAGRRIGEGMRLSAVAKPASYVILCRVAQQNEVGLNTVGILDGSVNNGPDPANDKLWEEYRPLFGGKAPYGFADGHVSMLNKDQALPVNPSTWNVHK